MERYGDWHTVRHYYDRRRADGTWERLSEAPSVLIVDSQSARSTEMGGEAGVDGGKGTQSVCAL